MLQKHSLSLAKSSVVENKRKELQRPPKCQYLYPVLFRVSLVQCTELDDTAHVFVNHIHWLQFTFVTMVKAMHVQEWCAEISI